MILLWIGNVKIKEQNFKIKQKKNGIYSRQVSYFSEYFTGVVY